MLGERLHEERFADPVVLGLPRGGVVVAAEVARKLDAPLDIVVARKLGVPWQPELAFGAVAPGVVVLRDDIVDATGLDRRTIEDAGARTSAQLDSLARRYRGDTAAVPLRGRTAIIVDDGLATGATATAAVRSIRRDEPARVVVAVPVCAVDTATALRGEADTVICLGELQGFRAVGLHYDDFAAVSDDVVREALERAEARGDGARAR
ncbi:MAG TPA: phosphoribosyltransferase family protein [Candidatus Limnocylindria bacterium]